MDHLRLPTNPVRVLPRVPIFTTVEYDGGGPFVDYLQRIDWEDWELYGSDSHRTSAELNAVLQTWTFFGLLSSVLQRPVQIREFTDDSAEPAGMRYLTTEKLPLMLHEWVHLQSRLSKSNRAANEAHMQTCFVKLAQIYDAIGTRITNHNPIDSGLRLSVEILYETLWRMHIHAFHAPAQEFPPSFGIHIYRQPLFGASSHLLAEMQEFGWCKSEIYRIARLNTSEQCIAYCIDRPGPTRDHSACIASKCVAYQMNEQDYQTRHTTTDCACEFVHCSQEQVTAVLTGKAGAIPLVSAAEPTREMDGKLWAGVVPSKSRYSARHAEFVAISHVWSDGLGNNRNNAIPLCQFRRLAQLVTTAAQSTGGKTPVLFWFDTLCFPLQPVEGADSALIRMRECYEDSRMVLVLDSYLLSRRLAEMDMTETVIRICLSAWNRRLWTLQEGVLPRRLLFQFVDHCLSAEDLIEETNDDLYALQGTPNRKKSLEEEPLPTASMRALIDLRANGHFDLQTVELMTHTLRHFGYHVRRLLSLDLQHYIRLSFFLAKAAVQLGRRFLDFVGISTTLWTRSPPLSIRDAKRALMQRGTSVKADEPLCLGNLLGINPAVIVQAGSHEARMKAVWDSAYSARNRGWNQSPAMIVFTVSPRMTVKGYRWAPQTLMDGDILPECEGITREVENAVITTDGLLATIPAVLVEARRVHAGKKFEFSTCVESAGGGGMARLNNYVVEWRGELPEALSQGDAVESSRGYFAILTSRPLERAGVPQDEMGIPANWLADLVGGATAGSPRIVVRLLARVDIRRYTENTMTVWTPDELQHRDSCHFRARALVQHRFLID